MDFYRLKRKKTREGEFAYPDFKVGYSKDLLVKGGGFHALWDEKNGLWTRNEIDVARILDKDIQAFADELGIYPLLLGSFESKSWTTFRQYVGTLMDSEAELDTTLNFANDPVDRERYASKRLSYSLVDGDISAWDEIVGTLYAPLEREKIEWSIGSIVAGDSKTNQKFLVFYGDPGTGKGTILNIVEKLFQGYCVPFDAKSLTGSNGFALTPFKSNPLVAIQQDGDLSRIEDNTRLNSLVSHEIMSINEKFKAEYYARVYAFLMMGTNEPVKITNSKSGLLRRLIDVHPSGNLISHQRYPILVNQIDFELGAIANHCLKVYRKLGKNHYANYRPTAMMYETDVFFNYIEHNFELFFTQDGITLEKAWSMYKEFCEDALIKHRLTRPAFRSELQSYFESYSDRTEIDGHRVRSYYSGFKSQRFVKVDDSQPLSLTLDKTVSLLDTVLGPAPAQYAKDDGNPEKFWDDAPRDIRGKTVTPRPDQVVSTTLSDLDTSKLHFVKVPEDHIVIDFDLVDDKGEKSLELNLAAAAEWPPTYAELSKGGNGVHLHYKYVGDVHQLKSSFKEGIEIKTLLGNSSLRRKLTKCNDIPIATISSGLPLKEKPMQDSKAMTNEKSIRALIIRNLKKEIHPNTTSSVSFIKKILDDAYISGIPYDVSDLRPDIFSFAMDSTNQARFCMDLVKEMKFASEELELKTSATEPSIVFYDVEVFPNLFVVCWKPAGEGMVTKMINPTPQEIDKLLGFRLVGFNCRKYDNHILYAAAMGYNTKQLYDLSKNIIEKKTGFFGAAYDLSYTDIYDFSSKKQSLKMFEIELGIRHVELGLPWDEDVPKELWETVADYCANDVVATEATFEARKGDFLAREILAALSGLSVNHTTNSHSTKIIFGDNKKPQGEFVYTDLSEMFPGYDFDIFRGKEASQYRGEVVGEGGYVYAEPGYHQNVALLDVASMHPSSIENLNLFGDRYTPVFSDIKNARVAIKRKDFDGARRMLDGKLAPYLTDETQAKMLSDALKIVINSVYGLTSARFENPFKDPRNVDNIVAKRGALFMIELKNAVQEQGFTVAHIKTDSIKIPNATPEIIEFVFEFGKKYGYEFEHEATYDDFVLFNNAVYIAHDKDGWHATGAQFLHPYVFKTLLSKEEIVFDDLGETKSVAGGAIYLETMNERRFVGRVGRFVPIVPGSGGGTLLRIAEDKKTGEVKESAVSGTKGYEWLEAEAVRGTDFEEKIDMSYYDDLVTKAEKALWDAGYQRTERITTVPTTDIIYDDPPWDVD